jgi:hypothetical protein
MMPSFWRFEGRFTYAAVAARSVNEARRVQEEALRAELQPPQVTLSLI